MLGSTLQKIVGGYLSTADTMTNSLDIVQHQLVQYDWDTQSHALQERGLQRHVWSGCEQMPDYATGQVTCYLRVLHLVTATESASSMILFIPCRNAFACASPASRVSACTRMQKLTGLTQAAGGLTSSIMPDMLAL